MISTIGIVSLSSGIIGEDFVKHEVDLGVQRLKNLGLNPTFLPPSLFFFYLTSEEIFYYRLVNIQISIFLIFLKKIEKYLN